MVKISVDGDDKAVGTKLFVTPDLWENGKAKGKSAEANEINGQLKEVSARLTNHYHRILREEDFVTAEKLRNAFLGVGVMENCILKDFEHMNKEFGAMVEKGQRAKSTYNKYLAVYNHFKTFLWEKKKRTDMAYKELTKEIITEFSPKILLRHHGIFHHIVQDTCHDGLFIQLQIRQNDCHIQWMDDIRFSGLPELIFVSLAGDLIGFLDHGNIITGMIFLHTLNKLLI
jgi:hypothetical protein